MQPGAQIRRAEVDVVRVPFLERDPRLRAGPLGESEIGMGRRILRVLAFLVLSYVVAALFLSIARPALPDELDVPGDNTFAGCGDSCGSTYTIRSGSSSAKLASQ